MASRSTTRPTAGRGRRTAGDVVRGLAAAVLLLGVTLGVPAFLAALPGAGLPIRLPDLTQPDYDGGLLLTLLWSAAWIGWAMFTLSAVVELIGQLRGVRVPRLPALGITQRWAGALVAAVLALLSTAPIAAAAAPSQPTVIAVSATFDHTAPPTAAEAEADPKAGTGGGGAGAAPAAAAAQTTGAVLPTYLVQPRDCLWDLAETFLGDGKRFTEIVVLNRGLPQPDGRSLSDADEVEPGWTLRLPADAHGPGLRWADGNPPPSTGAGARQNTTVVVAAGESLSVIADRELGDADRWREIFALNRGRPQADGYTLRDPNVIEPGWRLLLPAGAPAAPNTVPPNLAPSAVDPPHQPQSPPPSAETAPSATPAPQDTPTAAPTQPQEQPPAAAEPDADSTDSAEDSDADLALPISLSVGALLAAGLLTVLTRRRRAQRQRRVPPQRIHLPPPPAETLERQMRATEDPLSVEFLDRALRAMAQRLGDDDRDLPDLAGVLLREDQLELVLAHPAAAVAPFATTDSASARWTLDASYLPALRAIDVTDVTAPYPALVCIGSDGAGTTVLVDLETAGALTLVGTPEHTRDAFRAIALELATNSWSDHLLITLVGVAEELPAAIATGRCRHVEDLDRVLAELEARSEDVTRILAQSRVDSVLAARSRDIAPDAWTPHIVLIGDAPSPGQQLRLDAVLKTLPRTCVAAIVPADAAAEPLRAAWALTVDPGQPVTLPGLDIAVIPQLLDDGSYPNVLDLFRAANDATGAPGPAWVDAEALVEPRVEILTRAASSPASPTAIPPITALVTALPDPAPAADASGEAPGGHDPAADAREAGVDEPATAADAAPAQRITVTEIDPAAPEIRVLGPVEVIGATGPIESGRISSATELAALLALNPGLSATEVSQALWPARQPTSRTRNPLMSRLRSWLGTDPNGLPYVPTVPDGGDYRLADAVRCDWTKVQTLALRGLARGQAGVADLQQALDIVRGQPFADASPRRYAWAEDARQEMFSTVVDIAHCLGQRHLEAGDLERARAALRRGLDIDPIAEVLYRGLFRVEYRAGNRKGLDAAFDALEARCQDLDTEVQPETIALYKELREGHPAKAQ